MTVLVISARKLVLNVKLSLKGMLSRSWLDIRELSYLSVVAKLFQLFQESEHSMSQSERLTSAWTLYILDLIS